MNKKRNYAKLDKRITELEKRIAALEGTVQAQHLSEPINTLLQSEKTINQIRADYGLNSLKDKSADKLLITKE